MSNYRFAGGPASARDPSHSAAAITPNDSTDLTTPCRSIYVGTGGDVKVTLYADETAVVFANVPAGSILPIIAARVWNTDTTASDLVALY